MPGWIAEREVDIEAARDAIVRRHPRLAGQPARVLGQGWDNVVIVVGDVLLRVAVREVADALMRQEWHLLPALADLPTATPELLDHGEPEPGLPGPWALLRPVPGRELAERLAVGVGLADPSSLGRALRALHEPRRAAPLQGVLPVDPLRRSDPGALCERVVQWQERALEAGLSVPTKEVATSLERTACAPVGAEPVLVHGDLHLRHLLVDEAGRLTGIIDWGDACLAPPSADLGVAFWGLLPEQRPTFFEAYGEVDAATMHAARRFAIFSALALAVAGTDLGQHTVVRAATEALRRALIDVPAR